MPTEGEKGTIRRLVAAGRSYQQIADELDDWTPEQVRLFARRMKMVKTPKPETKPQPRKRVRKRVTIRTNGEFGIAAAGIRMDYIGAQPKLSTIEERERAYGAPRSLTALVCGDPPAGRSALDRKLGAAR